MPDLIIEFVGGGWQATFANTNSALEFAGGSGTTLQAENVELLAQIMAGDAPQAAILDFFEGGPLVAAGEEDSVATVAANLIESIFATVDSLSYEGAVVYTAAQGATLAEELEAAGEALLALL